MSPRSKVNLHEARMFLTTLYSQAIQRKKCYDSIKSLSLAEERMTAEWPIIEMFLKKFFSESILSHEGLTLFTKPMIHELFKCEKDGGWLYHPHYDDFNNRLKSYKDGNGTYIFKKWGREKKFDVGRAIILLTKDCDFTLDFENKSFHHGHLIDGKVGCWNEYKDMASTINANGIIAAVTSIYNFAKFSRYGSYLEEEINEYAGI